MGEILLWVKNNIFSTHWSKVCFRFLIFCVYNVITDSFFVYDRQLREAFNSMNTSNDGRLSLSDVSKKKYPQRIIVVIWETETEQLSQLELYLS